MSFPWAENYAPKNPLMRYLDEKLPLPRLVYNAVGAGYPVPRNLNYFWNFGVLAGVALVIQIITGIVLAMHYRADAGVAFNSVEHIMRDVNAGWFLRYCHATGASMFFIVLYTHIFRGLYYGSYKPPREVVWLLGVVIFLLTMATAFMGYVLPWGQMSFWGAQVITGFFSAIPVVGDGIRVWLLGGYAPDAATLNRFFSLHYLLPFVIFGVIILHIWALHHSRIEQPDRHRRQGAGGHRAVPSLLHGEGRLRAGRLFDRVRCDHVLHPELSRPSGQLHPGEPAFDAGAHRTRMVFLALLRDPQIVHRQFPVDPRQAVGRAWRCSGRSCCTSSCRGSTARRCARRTIARLYKKFFWLLVVDVIILGYCGGAHPSNTIVIVSQLCTMYYFAHFLLILPLVSMIERPLPLPNSISESVLHGEAQESAPYGVAAAPVAAPAE